MEKTVKAQLRGKEIKKRRVHFLVCETHFQADWDAINDKKPPVTKTGEPTEEMNID